MHETMTLNLINPMHYGIAECSFDDTVASIYERENGFEALFRYRIIKNIDSIELIMDKAAFGHLKNGHDQKKQIMTLSEGRYIFRQLEIPKDEQALKRAFLAIAFQSSSDILYVRLIKENSLEACMQFMLPC